MRAAARDGDGERAAAAGALTASALPGEAVDDRAGDLAAPLVAAPDELHEHAAKALQVGDPGIDKRKLLDGEHTRLAAALRVSKPQQALNFGERESQFLGPLDEPQPRNGGLGVATHTPQGSRRLFEKFQPLVVPYGFHIYAGRLGDPTDGQVVAHGTKAPEWTGLTPYSTPEFRVNPVELVAEDDMDAVKTDLAARLDGPAKAVGDGYSKATLAGGLFAGLLASACCVGPLVLVTAGISGAWISNLTLLEPYRWIFVGIALVFMALAWRRIYRAPAAADCEPGTVCALPQANGRYRLLFWGISALVLLAFAFPYFAPLFY